MRRCTKGALAVPLHRHTALIRRSAKAVVGALVVGTLSAILSGALTVRALGGGRELWVSMAPKSSTAPIAMGFAMGLASHGIATARAFQEDEIAGTFAALAMALNGIATVLSTPVVIGLLDRIG